MERHLKNSNYSILMNKRDLEKLSKKELIELLLKKKEPKVDIVDTKPKRSNLQPPPIPEVKPKQTVKLRRKQKVVDDRPGWVKKNKKQID